MRLFPGVNTADERKRFAIFHTCTLLLSPILGAFVMLIINGRWSLSNDRASWLLGSLFIWNFLGSWRFFYDALDKGYFIGKIVSVLVLVGFPFVYIHNLWCVCVKRNNVIT